MTSTSFHLKFFSQTHQLCNIPYGQKILTEEKISLYS
jgi:hypothetical protein